MEWLVLEIFLNSEEFNEEAEPHKRFHSLSLFKFVCVCVSIQPSIIEFLVFFHTKFMCYASMFP
jgi:hypothetical protein